jgi:hypothetical protein
VRAPGSCTVPAQHFLLRLSLRNVNVFTYFAISTLSMDCTIRRGCAVPFPTQESQRERLLKNKSLASILILSSKSGIFLILRQEVGRVGGLAYRPTRFGSEEGSNCCKRGAKYSSSCVGGGAGGGAGYNLHTSLGKRSDGTGVHASLGVRYPTATAAQIAAQALNRPFHGKPVSSSAAAVRPHQIADPRPKATPNLGAPDALGYSAKPSKNPLMTRRLTTVLTARRAIVPKIASG